ncbi:RecX family transcriptional regulator [Candidatus Microgenomates bacterium]|nr:RecX family transcriptional regulator [Candidatus Microgenomates bacterium]
MPRITKISPQKRRQRVNIFLDEKFAFGLDLETFSKYNLRVDQEISQEKIEEIIKEEEFFKIYEKVLRFLSFRPRSKKEVKDYFYKKDVGDETQKMIIKKLEKLKFLDDEQFTLWWVEQRTTFRPSGKRLLRYELRKKGISEEIIENILTDEFLEKTFKKERETQEAIAGRLYPSFESEMALKAAQKKLRSYEKLLNTRHPELDSGSQRKKIPKRVRNDTNFEFRKKMTAFLARRGFSWEVIKEVIDNFNKEKS